ncbi:MAG: chemotaxis protein CheX [Planctomycetota bacterium]|nr:chemotaxis protein CheX [Planctomycetota bacterium]
MAQLATDQPTSEKMKITADQVTQMTNDLFDSMLGMHISGGDVSEAAPPQDWIQSKVQIQGAWNGELRVVASGELSAAIARAMFGSEAENLVEQEILDALGEVANVIGGNVKGHVDQDCDLTLPEIGEPEQVSGNSLCQQFTCAESLLYVVLVQ